jgi:hypothetical protein
MNPWDYLPHRDVYSRYYSTRRLPIMKIEGLYPHFRRHTYVNQKPFKFPTIHPHKLIDTLNDCRSNALLLDAAF